MNCAHALLRAWSLLASLSGLINAQYLVPSPAAVFTAAGSNPSLRGLVAEVNGNATPDLVYSDGVLPAFHVCLDPAVNGLATAVTYATTAAVPAAAPAPALATGDIDGDGFGDVVAALGDPMRQIWVWRGTASGTLVLAAAPLPIADVWHLAVADMQGDGRDDVIVMRISPSLSGNADIFVLSNQPGGTWTASGIPLQGLGTNVATGDFNGDGFRDVVWVGLATTGSFGGMWQLWVAYGNGAGGLSFPIATDVVSGPCFWFGPLPAARVLATPDFDEDGRDDVLGGYLSGYHNFNSQSCYSTVWTAVHYGRPAGGGFDYGPALGLSTFFPPTAAAGDWDMDSRTDVLVPVTISTSTSPPTSSYNLYRATGGRSFSPVPIPNPFPSPTPPGAPLVADFDADGDLDIVTTPVPSTRFFENLALDRPGCPGTAGQFPVLGIDPPDFGNAGFGISLSNARPWSAAVLVVSLVRDGASPACAPGIDLGSVILSNPVVTDGGGGARVALPLPIDPNLHGARVFAQWGVVDPAGGSVFPGPGLAYSPSRAIIIW